MKKKLTYLILIAVLLSLTTGVFAADGLSPLEEAYQLWEENQYPDDVGGVYYDRDTDSLAILVVYPSDERKDELYALFGRDLVITECRYSYNELLYVQNEITGMMSQEQKIYSSGIGWTSKDGVVSGFGESGKEFRVVVGVDESEFARYSADFAEKYGDMVVVESSEQATAQADDGRNEGNDAAYVNGAVEGNSGGNNFWLFIAVGACLLGLIIFMLWRRKQSI